MRTHDRVSLVLLVPLAAALVAGPSLAVHAIDRARERGAVLPTPEVGCTEATVLARRAETCRP